jgi:hypothetical protein
VSLYTYAATDLLTGGVLGDSLPLNVQSFSMQLNGGGTMSAQLNLNEVYAVNAPFVAALTARRAVLWALEDGFPVWCGVVWDWPDMSRANGTLPISAQTIDTVWSHRLITDTLEYAAVDLFTAFIDLVIYGTTKNSNYIDSESPAATRPQAYLDMVAVNGRVAGLVLPSGPAAVAGQPWTASYTYSDLTQVSSAWSDMCASGNLTFAFLPGLTDTGELGIFLQLNYEDPGSPPASSGLVLSYPGNVLDYGYQVTGSQSSNYIWATAPPNGSDLQWQSVFPFGADLTDLASGFPLMESTVSWQGSVVTSQDQVNAFAAGQVQMVTQGMVTPTINIGSNGYPRVQDLILGDSAWLAATSSLHPPVTVNGQLQPGLQQQVRITGWTVYPDAPQQSPYIQLTTSGVVLAA